MNRFSVVSKKIEKEMGPTFVSLCAYLQYEEGNIKIFLWQIMDNDNDNSGQHLIEN